MDINDFMQNEEPKRKGKLIPWKKDLQKLYENGYSYSSMVRYLEANGVTIQHAAVRQFCLRHFEATQIKKNKSAPIENKTAERAKEVIVPADNQVEKQASEAKEIPQHRRLPAWHNVDGIESIDDLI